MLFETLNTKSCSYARWMSLDGFFVLVLFVSDFLILSALET